MKGTGSLKENKKPESSFFCFTGVFSVCVSFYYHKKYLKSPEHRVKVIILRKISIMKFGGNTWHETVVRDTFQHFIHFVQVIHFIQVICIYNSTILDYGVRYSSNLIYLCF